MQVLRAIAIGSALVFVFFVIACAGFGFDVALRLVFGWHVLLRDFLADLGAGRIDLKTLVVVLALTLGTHWLARWIRGRDRSWPLRWTVALVGMVLVTSVAAMSFVGLWQSSYSAVGADPLYNSTRGGPFIQLNLRQMAVALINFESDHGRLPAATSYDQHGTMMHGWQVQLLPYVEQKALYDRVDFALPWDHSKNAEVFKTEVGIFQNPKQPGLKDAQGYALSHFAGNARVFDPAASMKDIANGRGTANTFLAAEVANPVPWGYPRNVRDPALGFNTSPRSFGKIRIGPVPTWVVMCDGSVRSVNIKDPESIKIYFSPETADWRDSGRGQ